MPFIKCKLERALFDSCSSLHERYPRVGIGEWTALEGDAGIDNVGEGIGTSSKQNGLFPGSSVGAYTPGKAWLTWVEIVLPRERIVILLVRRTVGGGVVVRGLFSLWREGVPLKMSLCSCLKPFGPADLSSLFLLPAAITPTNRCTSKRCFCH